MLGIGSGQFLPKGITQCWQVARANVGTTVAGTGARVTQGNRLGLEEGSKGADIRTSVEGGPTAVLHLEGGLASHPQVPVPKCRPGAEPSLVLERCPEDPQTGRGDLLPSCSLVSVQSLLLVALN